VRTVRRAESVGKVEQEIRQAKAEALGRTGERLEQALTQLAELDRRLDARIVSLSREPAAAEALAGDLETRNRVRDEALRLSEQLKIQREAIGVFRHGSVEAQYPVPPRRRVSGVDTMGYGSTHEHGLETWRSG